MQIRHEEIKRELFFGQSGLSLFEIMLSLLLVSVALLGLTQTQLLAFYYSKQAYFINLANIKNDEFAEIVTSCSKQFDCIHTQTQRLEKKIVSLFPSANLKIYTAKNNDISSQIAWHFNSPSRIKIKQISSLQFPL